MRKTLTALIAIALVCGLTGSASAHIGDKVVLLFEASDADIADIDLSDGSVEDWEDVFGAANLVPAAAPPVSGWVGCAGGQSGGGADHRR